MNTYGIDSDPFSLAGTVLAKFNFIGATAAVSNENAVGKDGNGEFVPATEKSFNEKTEYTAEYEANDNEIEGVGGGSVPVGGATALAITRIAVATKNKGQARITVTGHKHGAALHNLNARSIALPAFNGFGATNFAALTGVVDAEVTESTWEVEVGHEDRENNVGNFLCGRSQGVKLACTESGVSDAEPALPAETDWISDGFDKKHGQDFWTFSFRAHQTLGPAGD